MNKLYISIVAVIFVFLTIPHEVMAQQSVVAFSNKVMSPSILETTENWTYSIQGVASVVDQYRNVATVEGTSPAGQTVNNLESPYFGSGPCLNPVTVNFEEGGLSEGDFVNTQIPGVPISVTDAGNAPNSQARKPMIFDSACPGGCSGGDGDLITPGYGAGNNFARGQVLIISEDNNQGNPNDSDSGGTLVFDFDNLVDLISVSLLDMDDGLPSAALKAFNNGNQVGPKKDVFATGDNSYQSVSFSRPNINKLEVILNSDGAVATVKYCPTTGEATCSNPVTINFEEGGLSEGDFVSTQIPGVTISVTDAGTVSSGSHAGEPRKPMIFDSACPGGCSGGDGDLITPGYGAGNNFARAQILIISEDNNQGNPNDSDSGGTLVFDFDSVVELISVSLLDMDDGSPSATLKAFRNGNLVGSKKDVFATGDNSYQSVSFSRPGINKLEVKLNGDGAVTSVKYCPAGGEAPAIDVEKATNGQDADNPTGPQVNWGDPVTWTYVVTNSGDVPLSNVTLTDDLSGVIAGPESGDTNNNGILENSETWTYSSNGSANVLGQYSNEATASGISPANQTVDDMDPSHYFGISNHTNPRIDLEKYTSVNGPNGPWNNAVRPDVPAGDDVWMRITIENIGDSRLTNLSLTDVTLSSDGVDYQAVLNAALGSANCPNIPNILQISGNDTWECVFGPFTALDGLHENRATVNGNGLDEQDNNNGSVTDNDPAGYNGVQSVCPLNPNEYDYLITIDEQLLDRAPVNGNPHPDELTSVFNVNIPAGAYQVALVSFDSHSTTGGQNQNEEQWFARLFDAGNNEVFQSSFIDDLPDDQDFITQIVDANGLVTGNATTLQGFHRGSLPEPNGSTSINAIHALCIGFKRVDDAGIDVEKEVSVDGGSTWFDADAPTGPNATLGANNVFFRFTVTNSGDVELTNIDLTDTDFNIPTNQVPGSMDPGDTFQIVLGPFVAQAGQHMNESTISGQDPTGSSVTDIDSAHYIVEIDPGIDIEKEVSVDGGSTWFDADDPTGPEATAGANNVFFRFTVTNTGDVTLDSIDLADTNFNIPTNQVPDSMDPGDTFQIVLGPFVAEGGQHLNESTVTGQFSPDSSVTDKDKAHYFSIPELDPQVVSKTASDTVTVVGDTITYTIIVKNSGFNAASGVVVSDAIPPDLTYLPGSIIFNGTARTDADDTDNADFGITTANTVIVNIGAMAPAQQDTITFKVIVEATVNGAMINNTATVAASQDDDPNNNSASIMIKVAANINLHIDAETQLVFWDEIKKQFQFELQIINTSNVVLFSPLFVKFVSIETDPTGQVPEVMVVNADRGGTGVGAIFDYSELLSGDEKLEPGESTSFKLWIFDDPGEFNFHFFANVFGLLASPAPVAKTMGGTNTPIKFYADVKNQTVELTRSPTSVEASTPVEFPMEFQLHQNYPNPFNPETTIRFQLSKTSEVTLNIYNMNGQLVKALVSEEMGAGFHEIVWYARDDTGKSVPSGLFLYRIQAGNFIQVRKLMLLR